jgi:hypothetical protein
VLTASWKRGAVKIKERMEVHDKGAWKVSPLILEDERWGVLRLSLRYLYKYPQLNLELRPASLRFQADPLPGH